MLSNYSTKKNIPLISNEQMEYQVEFDDKIRSMISVTYGPMKDLIAKYERDQAKKGQSKKGKQNEDEKENLKL